MIPALPKPTYTSWESHLILTSQFKSGNMKSTSLFILLLTLILLNSCSKEIMTPITPDETAVVESYLYAGDSVITVQVTNLLPFSDDTMDATSYISGLHIRINGAELTETGNGIYKLELGSQQIQPGATYTMKFLYYSDTVSSVATIPDRPVNFHISSNDIYADRDAGPGGGGMPPEQMEDVKLTWDNTDGSYYYVLIEYLEDTPDYINSMAADLEPSTTQSIAPMVSTSTTLGRRNLYFFGSYRIVLFKVNQDFVDLYHYTEVNSNTIADPVTTINNGYGLFTGMASDTVFLEVHEN